MSEIFIIKDTGKGVITGLNPEKVVPINSGGGTTGDYNSYSTTETLTGGTWIDGKPIYTITKLTADPVPSDMETQFPNIIVGSHTVYKYTKTTD